MTTCKIVGNGLLYPGFGAEFIENGAVYFENDVIVAVGKTDELKEKFPKAEFMDAEGNMIMPGFINAHGHYYGAFCRGMALKDEAPANFPEILERLWWRLDKALTPEDNYLTSMLCLENAVRSGTTTVLDHHASPNHIEGSLDQIEKAAEASGVRHCLCYEVTDRNGVEGADAGIKESVRFLKKVYEDKKVSNLIGASFGLHASFTCCDETLKKCTDGIKTLSAEAQARAGFHVHICEDATDNKDSAEKYNSTTVERLEKAGVLGPNTIAGHCVFVTDSDIEILKKTQTSVVSNPESNMNNGVGVPDAEKLLKAGVPVGLGTDGITYDMQQESKTNYFVHKLVKNDPRVMGAEPFEMLFKHNAAIASKFFNHNVGYIKEGNFADIIIVKYDPPTFFCAGNLPWHMQFGMHAGMVETTICGGKTLMYKKEIQSFDTKKVMADCRTACPGIWERF